MLLISLLQVCGTASQGQDVLWIQEGSATGSFGTAETCRCNCRLYWRCPASIRWVTEAWCMWHTHGLHMRCHRSRYSRELTLPFPPSGPDTEFLKRVLKDIGDRHSKIGVSPSFFPSFGKALIYALEETIPNKEAMFTSEHRRAWQDVYEVVSYQIVKAMLNEQ